MAQTEIWQPPLTAVKSPAPNQNKGATLPAAHALHPPATSTVGPGVLHANEVSRSHKSMARAISKHLSALMVLQSVRLPLLSSANAWKTQDYEFWNSRGLRRSRAR